ncbi:MAG: FIST N-terminal domain-containing protein [Candidatus Hodarchaeales archaeon]
MSITKIHKPQKNTLEEKDLVAVAHDAGRDFLKVTMNCAKDLAAKMNNPDLIMFFPSNYRLSKKDYKESMKILREFFPESQMCGGYFCGTFSQAGHSLRGATIAGFKGINAKIIRIKRPRIRSKVKGRKVATKIKKAVKEGNNSAVIAIIPGPYFPSIFVNQLKSPKKFHAFKMMNSPLIRKIPFLDSIIGKVMGMTMDLLGWGIPLNPLSKLLGELHKKDIPFVGALTADPITYDAAPVFVNFDVSYKDAFLLLLQSETLFFGISAGTAITYDREDPLNIEKFISGGFITQINGKWGKHAFLEKLEIDADQYYKATRPTFYFDIYHPVVVEDPACEYNVLVALGANPNMSATLHTATDRTVKRIIDKKAKAYVGHQSATDITDGILQTLKRAKNEHGIEKIEFGMLFECTNRMMVLGDQFGKLVEKDNEFFSGAPYIGLGAGGELVNKSVPTTVESVVSLIVGRKPVSTC